MRNIVSYSNIFESKEVKKKSPLFETCSSFNLDEELTVEQLRMIDELVITEGRGYLDLVAIKEGWDVEDISEEYDYPEDMTFAEFIEKEFEGLDEESFAQCLVDDLGLDDLSEAELKEFCNLLNESNFFEDLDESEIYELNEGFFKKIGQAFKKVGQGIAKGVKSVGQGIKKVAQNIKKISLKDIGKALKKALPIIIMVASIALTCVGVPAGLAIASKSLGFLSKGMKVLQAAQKVQKAGKLVSTLNKAKKAIKGLKAVKKISSLANKTKKLRKTLDIVAKGAKKIKQDFAKRGAEALESPDNQQIAGTMAATYHAATEGADAMANEMKEVPDDPAVAAKMDAEADQASQQA
jgi:hypothetical protein